MKIHRYIILVLALLVFSCDNDVNIDFPDRPNFPPNGTNCLRGEGAVVMQSRTIADPFTEIKSSIFADILVTQGAQEDIILEGQQNILDQINTEVINGELHIELDRCISIVQAVKVHITIPDIESLELEGVGDVVAQNDFDLTDLRIRLTGTGNFRLQGVATFLDIDMTGVGDVRAFDLISDICEVQITGVGNVEVTVNDELDVSISGVGDVYYRGNPMITSNVTGTGAVIDAN
ncbi:MAG: DUF2807 domain-containing protein [Flavobacteriaceae bacterium]|nr:DUF2807 domain-containing protein [Flavobacteriaceae bacterium]